MSYFAPYTAVENTRRLAGSALPDAPVVDEPVRRTRTGPGLRARLGTALRTAAHHELRLAERIDPVSRCSPQAG